MNFMICLPLYETIPVSGVAHLQANSCFKNSLFIINHESRAVITSTLAVETGALQSLTFLHFMQVAMNMKVATLYITK